MAEKQIAVVRVRGKVNLSHEIARTLQQLNLKAQNTCAILPATGTVMGMLQKVNGYVTYGAVSEALIAELRSKRKSNTEDVFHLHPPRKGYGRKGIKRSYAESGALGDRKEEINDLLTRML